MIFLTLYIFLIIIAVGCCFWAAFSDYRFLKIPNIIPILVISAFLGAVGLDLLLSDVIVFASLKSHFISGIAVFVITAVLFYFGVFGAGDAKLLSAYAFWSGLQGLPTLFMIMGIVGGVLALLSIVIKKMKVSFGIKNSQWIKSLNEGRNAVPYGIAIAAGAIFVFLGFGYASLDMLSQF